MDSKSWFIFWKRAIEILRHKVNNIGHKKGNNLKVSYEIFILKNQFERFYSRVWLLLILRFC